MKKNKSVIPFVLSAATCLFSGAVLAEESLNADIDKDLMLYFPFDGNLKDYSGHNRHGSALNSYQFIDTGKYNQAVQLVTAGIQVGKPDLLNGLNAYTVSFWVNVIEHEGNLFYDHSSNVGSKLINGGGLYSYYPDAPANESLASSNSGKMGEILLTGEWHHLAYVWDSENALYKVFIDGILFDQDTDLVNAELYSEPDDFFYIGAWDLDYSPFNGSIDEFKLFGRALTGTEIQNLAEQSQVSYNGTYDAGYTAGIGAVMDNPKAFGVPGDAVLFEDFQLELPSVLYKGNSYKVWMNANENFQFNIFDAKPN